MSIRVDNSTSTTAATSTTSAEFAVARPTRRQITVRNLDATIAVHVAFDTAALTTHFTLPAATAHTFVCCGSLRIRSASGTPSVSVMDEYD